MARAVSLQSTPMTSNMILDTSQKYSKAEAMVILNDFKCKLGPKCGKNIKKLADMLLFYHTVNPRPQLGYDWGRRQ